MIKVTDEYLKDILDSPSMFTSANLRSMAKELQEFRKASSNFDWRVAGVALDRPNQVAGHYLVYLEQEGTEKRTVVHVMGQPSWSIDPDSGKNVILVDQLKIGDAE